LRETEGEKSTD